MKKIVTLFFLTLLISKSIAQLKENDLQLLKARIDTSNFHTNDVFNPINFTTIYQRKPAENGRASSEKLYNRASVQYIKKGAQLHIEFDQEFARVLFAYKKFDIRIKAFIERKDKSIKPLTVLGITNVEIIKDDNRDKLLQANSNDNIGNEYKITYLPTSQNNISAEIDLSWEEVNDDDKVIVQITNHSQNDVGYSNTFVYANYGWTNGPTSGFSFIQTLRGEDDIYRSAGTIGYSFRYRVKPSSSFWSQFFLPSFGPEVNVLQKDDLTVIGTGIFVSEFLNTIKFGVGYFINGESNKPYFSIGLNFIESYQKLTEVLNKSK